MIISLYLQTTWSKNDISLVHEISFIYLNFFLSLRPRKVGAMMRTIEVFNCMKRVEFQLQNVGICSNWYNRGCIYGFIDPVQLARLMAWCLTAPRHYLNKCGFLISDVLWHSPKSNQCTTTYFLKFHCSCFNVNVRVNVTEHLWWQVNLASSNCSVLSGSQANICMNGDL